MVANYVVFIAACFMLALTQVNGLQAVNGRIKVTIGTASGCRDTVNFISGPLVEAVGLYGEFLDIEFVPWGRTTMDENGVQTCQFQAPDCWANRLHRCVLNMLKGNQTAQVKYMTCEFRPPYPAFGQGAFTCVQHVGLNLIEVDHCVANPREDDLDRQAQEAAAAPMNPETGINFVPYIVFNDNIDINLHHQALQRFPNMICVALSEDPSTGVTNCSIMISSKLST